MPSVPAGKRSTRAATLHNWSGMQVAERQRHGWEIFEEDEVHALKWRESMRW